VAGHYRILVTGSRSWTDIDAIWQAFTLAAGRCPPEHVITLVNGQCDPIDPQLGEYVPWMRAVHMPRPQKYALPGLDWLAAQVAAESGWRLEFHPAAAGSGPRGPILRNVEMVHTRPDECLAFAGACTITGCRKPPRGLRHPTHGTQHCGLLAHTTGIPTTWWPGPGLAGWFTRKQHLTQGRNSPPCPQQLPHVDGVTLTHPGDGLLW
jgi:hypothetical protein